MDLVEVTSYALVLSPLIALLGLGLKMVLTSLSKDPLVQAFLNTTLVALESTEIVWKPVVNGILVPASLYVLSGLKPIAKSLLRISVMAFQQTLSLLRTLRAAGLDLGVALRQMSASLIEFTSALGSIVKVIGKGVYYLVTGLGSALAAVEKSLTVVQQALFNPEAVSWEDLTSVLIPLGVMLTLLILTFWSTRPVRPARPGKGVKTLSSPRRSNRIARRKAMLLSGESSPLFSPCKEASATPSNL
jgi:hypothetical protein